MKRCKCGSDGPFGKNRRNPDGLAFYCKACMKRINAEQYAIQKADPEAMERRRAASRAYAKRVGKLANARKQAEWRAKNPGRRAEAEQRLRRLDPERSRRNDRRSYWADPGKARQTKALWRKKNADSWGAISRNGKARRRARLLRVACTLTEQEWQEILEYFGHACAYCLRTDRPLTQDHVRAITRGGGHTAENVVPACLSCNSRKGNRPVWSVLRAA